MLFIVIRPEGRSDLLGVLTVFLYQYFVQTPAIGGVFIAGFLAPRRAGCSAILVGLVSAICYSFLVVRGFIGAAPTADTQNLARDVVLASFFLSPIIGALFASAAAWYRRFLTSRTRTAGAEEQRDAVRPDGRTRRRTRRPPPAANGQVCTSECVSEDRTIQRTSRRSDATALTEPAHPGVAELPDAAGRSGPPAAAATSGSGRTSRAITLTT